MDEKEMNRLLNSGTIPFAYHQWEKPPALPWGVFRLVNQSKFYADGELYYAVRQYDIELYTDKKDPDAEKAVEQLLDGVGITFVKNETYIDSEQLFEIIYEIEV